jgi:hypothetical protein
MNPYRTKIVDCYFLAASTHLAFATIALDICFLDELKDVEPYREDDDMMVSRDIFKTMKDPAVLRIDRFLDDTDIYLDQLQQNNNLLDEEVDALGEPLLPGAAEDFERIHYLKMLEVYFKQHMAPKFEQYIGELCEMGNEIPISDYTNTDNCDDENIKSLAGFYVQCFGLIDHLYDNNFYENASS